MLRDLHKRPLRNLRLSVTDRCNLRCSYCMPEEDYDWLPRPALLTFEELTRLAQTFLQLGVTKLRLTGGEPLLRRELHVLVAQLAALDGLEDLALTTNAILLEGQASDLRRAGLGRLTVSLDTLKPDRFKASTRRADLHRVLAGLEAARAAGFEGTKLNCVLQRGFNDDELEDLVEFARAGAYELRFIEYMDVGGATDWSPERVVSRREILETLQARFGALRPTRSAPSAPAERLELQDGTRIGVIASTTAPFCGTCDRARLTADGRLFTCLYAREGVDLGRALRTGASVHELNDLICPRWQGRTDRGAEERLELEGRGRLAARAELQQNPHLEMHTRGG